MAKKPKPGSPEAEAQKKIKENEARIDAARHLTNVLKTAVGGSEEAKTEFFKLMSELTNNQFGDWLLVTKNDLKAKEDKAVEKYLKDEFETKLMKEIL